MEKQDTKITDKIPNITCKNSIVLNGSPLYGEVQIVCKQVEIL